MLNDMVVTIWEFGGKSREMNIILYIRQNDSERRKEKEKKDSTTLGHPSSFRLTTRLLDLDDCIVGTRLCSHG